PSSTREDSMTPDPPSASSPQPPRLLDQLREAARAAGLCLIVGLRRRIGPTPRPLPGLTHHCRRARPVVDPACPLHFLAPAPDLRRFPFRGDSRNRFRPSMTSVRSPLRLAEAICRSKR